jgi:hypothetical protein
MILFGENLFSARIISFTSSMIIGILIFLIVYKITRDKFLGIISSFLFFSSFITFYLSSLARVEALAALFSILGIYFITRHKKKLNIFLATIFFTLSIFTKQTYIAAPLASFIYLFLKDRKNSFKFLLTFLVSSASIFFLMDFLSNGQFFLHILKYNVGVLKFDYNLLFLLVQKNLIFLLIGFLYFLKKRSDLFSIYFIISLLIFVARFMRIGGSIYYFFELTIVTSIITCLFLKKYIQHEHFLLIIVLFQLILFIQSDPREIFFILQPDKYPPLVNLPTDEKISHYIQNSPSKVLVEHASFNLMNGKEVPPDSFSVYELERNNILNKTKVLEFYKSQNYSFVIFYSRFVLIEGLRDYIEKNYELVDKVEWQSLEYVNRMWLIYRRI